MKEAEERRDSTRVTTSWPCEVQIIDAEAEFRCSARVVDVSLSGARLVFSSTVLPPEPQFLDGKVVHLEVRDPSTRVHQLQLHIGWLDAPVAGRVVAGAKFAPRQERAIWDLLVALHDKPRSRRGQTAVDLAIAVTAIGCLVQTARLLTR